jgi:hypothetical protein
MPTAKPTETFHFTQIQSIRLAALVAEHDDLDSAIAVLLERGACDDLLVTRLKKRKLQIKDEIAAATPPQGHITDHIAARATA